MVVIIKRMSRLSRGQISKNDWDVNHNAKTAIAKRLAVQILNPNVIHKTKKFSANDEKQSEKRKR